MEKWQFLGALIGSPVLLALIQWLLQRVNSPMKRIEDSLISLKLEVLQLKVCNKELPGYARVAAYDEYKKLGGNSWVDAYIQAEGLIQAKDRK